MKQTRQHQYMAALQFFSLALRDAPRDAAAEARLRGLADGGFFLDWRDWPCFAPPAQRDQEETSPREALAALSQALPPGMNDDQWRERTRAMRRDHLRLFSGPAPLAPPWESVWRERDKLLFGECTRQVADLYRRSGLEIDKAGHEPEDHLGLELAFAFYLLQHIPMDEENRSSAPLSSADHDARAEAEAARTALADFLDRHLLLWAGPCLRKAEAEAESAVYRQISRLCLVLLRNLRKDLERGELFAEF
jgi:TorA maturation chaperone TorD